MEGVTRTDTPGVALGEGSQWGQTTVAWLGGLQLGWNLHGLGIEETLTAVCCG